MQFGRIPGSWSLESLGGTAVVPAQTRTGPDTQFRHAPGGAPLTRTALTKTAEMNLSFDPSESLLVGSSTRIVFGQTCQIVADGKVLSKPSQFVAAWKFRDPFTLDNGVFLDVFEDATDPYYPVSFQGRHVDKGSGLGFISEAATMGDAPQIGKEQIMFDPVKNPRGFKEATLKLQTFAVSAKGKDGVRWYEGALWEWSITAAEHQSGGRGRATMVVNNVGAVTLDMLEAFAKFISVTGKQP